MNLYFIVKKLSRCSCILSLALKFLNDNSRYFNISITYFRIWRKYLIDFSVPYDFDFLKLPLLHGMQFRQAIKFVDIPRVYENMSLLQFLPSPLVVIDPLNISIEYLFTPSQTGIIYCGDPEFEAEFDEMCKKFDSIIVRHFVFDVVAFRKTYEQFIYRYEYGRILYVCI